MDLLLLLKALVLGLVEGLTEFLPVSSTGHLILVGELIDFTGDGSKVFDVAIQFGAILAVCWEYRERIGQVVRGLTTKPPARRFALNVIVACLPAVVMGLLFEKHIKALLFSPVPVAVALIVGGIILLWVEAAHRRRDGAAYVARVQSIDELTVVDALKVGLAQCFALIPGTSRSGATIVGGLLTGLERRVATEFSFFLAIPLIFGATVYELVKARDALSVSDMGPFTVGFATAFVSAFACVRWLLRYIATHDFTVFAWYRIGFGLLVLGASYLAGVTFSH
ncbi:Undecaprenyl-diphosphatase (EC 3.6.1.27) (Bacitracin resistance protein) [Mycetohabitans rhizoxinica HKI 454]|uniref:Undecaprenyl-diphosphatase n=1 Tax=Mycetohabitans rhizoxinica (strain DSM 19002 / CIP 109453 / HKI 454) TaxID=882378 RepID=E5ATG4_MYCRK|nr:MULTISPECIES: undecaprenyl-diphosphate phosphatase [Mycetohabitans]MCG1047751.1 undecaprenyl-diphosphate phosphatase [Mycetohabitans sp. B6]CBW75838.1 Undecaprenyl-diphosphatase (EC 3.6.1.27) (Bacitracin resistance protein) [Mycetohabitans rhizoxinica HKI 454]